ncbi:MAG: hypothetical protein ACP5R5_06140, partial [Armatimonadota bacterium]
MLLKRTQHAASAVILALVISSPAPAAFRPKVSSTGGTLVINGRAAVRFRVPNGGLSPAER